MTVISIPIWVPTELRVTLPIRVFTRLRDRTEKTPYFDAALIRRIIQNPVYCGKIAYGRRRTEKVHGTRNDYHLVEKDDYILVDGRHEGIISEDDW